MVFMWIIFILIFFALAQGGVFTFMFDIFGSLMIIFLGLTVYIVVLGMLFMERK